MSVIIALADTLAALIGRDRVIRLGEWLTHKAKKEA